MDATKSTLKRKITAIMAADIAEYTRIVAEDEEEALARLESYRRVFDDFVARSGGRVFNTGGDSVMCEFQSAVEATRCAIDIQESLRTRNLALPPNRQMHFRIGISIGDVVERNGDLLGDGVNVAARLQTLAEPGSICVARNVQEAVANKISVPFRDLGHREVKNLPQPVHAFQIDMGGARPKTAPARMPASGNRLGRSPLVTAALGLVAGVAIAVGGAGFYLAGRGGETGKPTALTGLPATDAQPGPAPM
ncbi:MAG: adenylate/guanylate cyclase domain-containing protein, partial [Beijerinckiaceae bacterium]